mmetsp:Transcript_14601/g.28076  ORF Transcript_14601/g.28076 Transcript_14601/m.28076 type:complete len:443 (+) Transcript_14601:287-1615(+)|eukprot:CAMPEP_0114227086 /NCGR_PEP_ID=MMETSP0058-20121206/1593_1 /TAXON_ID=36894 /ORGANISM="Pyramimonas parkeae, CCMP726" /LENGTH=442 /DNA_ID=CAMNT_0001337885 /DNA_START=287 /DNA_END=1615 /DNA_ORIENTATION=-
MMGDKIATSLGQILILILMLGRAQGTSISTGMLREAQQHLEGAVAAVLDSVENRCLISPGDEFNKTGSVKDFDLKPVSQALRDYYHTMRSLDHTTQVETWTGMNTFQALRSSVQSGGQVYEQTNVQPMVQYAQLSRFANDVSRTIFAAETLVQCPATRVEGVLIGHYFANLQGREHAQNPEEDARYARQLMHWSKDHAARLGIKCLVVHDGIRESLLQEAQHPNLEFVHVHELPELKHMSWGSGSRAGGATRTFIDMRYHVTLATLELLQRRSPAPTYALVVDFVDVAFDRDPFAWMSLMGGSFDYFVNYEVEGNVAWLLEQFRVCFMGNPGVEPLGETLTSGTVYNPGVMGGTLASMQRLVRRIMEVLDMVGFDISQGYAGCDMAVVNRVMWDLTLQRHGELSEQRLFAGPPFSAPFRWAPFPERDPWTRVGNRCSYAYHK